MAMSMYCWRCGHDTPYAQLDAKPIWTLGLWLILITMGQRAALSYAADRGHDFVRLECALCYGPGYEPQPYQAERAEAAALISSLVAENAELSRSRADYVQGCKDIGATAKNNLDRAETAERLLAEAREALTDIAADLQSSIDTHEFNARHMIAEDSLQDAWKMLDMAREQFQVDANSLRIPLAKARATLSIGGG